MGERSADEHRRGSTLGRSSLTQAQPGQPLFGTHTTSNSRVVIFADGIPIQRDGQLVSAVGVSGVTSDQEQQAAEAGVAAF